MKNQNLRPKKGKKLCLNQLLGQTIGAKYSWDCHGLLCRPRNDKGTPISTYKDDARQDY